MMMMPRYHGATLRVPDDAVYRFYQAVFDAIAIPIIVQDSPVAGTPLSVPFSPAGRGRPGTSPN